MKIILKKEKKEKKKKERKKYIPTRCKCSEFKSPSDMLKIHNRKILKIHKIALQFNHLTPEYRL